MRRLLFGAWLLLFCINLNLSAQTLGVAAPTGTMAVKISQVLDLAVTTGSSVSFNFNTIASLDAGIETLNAVTLTYRSNQPWYINVNANSVNFTSTSATPMPASVIQVRNSAGGTYTPLSTSPISLSGTTSSKNTRGTATIGVDYKVNPGYNYAPATDYAMVITYTISNI